MSAPASTLPRTLRCLTAGTLLLLSAAAVRADLDSFAGVLGSVESQLSEQELKLQQQRSRKGAIEQELGAAGPATQRASEQLRRDARALYRVSRGGMLPVAGGMAALLGHASRISRLEQLVRRDLESVRSLSKNASMLRAEVSSLSAQIQSAERELSTLQVARVGAVRERSTQTTFEATFHGSLAPAPRAKAQAQYGLSLAGGGAVASERFSEQRGNLALPVSGPSRIQDATRAESDGPGLEFEGSAGAAVRAAAAGRIAFAENYGSYGRLVIVDHGERYYSVYGGLERLEVQVGDDLSKSARLGSVGSSPIYFEVRRGTKTQDARAWLGL